MIRLALPATLLVTGATQRAYAAAAAAAVVEVKSDKDFQKAVQSLAEKSQVGIVDFTAKWCGPCKFIAPHYEELARQNPDVKFMKVDIDDRALQQTVLDHNISGVPTFAVYKGAHRVESFTGARLEYLKDVIKKHSAK